MALPLPAGDNEGETLEKEPLAQVTATHAEQLFARGFVKATVAEVRSQQASPATPPDSQQEPQPSTGPVPPSPPAAPAVRPNPLAKANATAEAKLGANWRSAVHSSHRLTLAEPLIFCRVCGGNASTKQRLYLLSRICAGPPSIGSTQATRLQRLLEGRHPVTKVELAHAATLPPGAKG